MSDTQQLIALAAVWTIISLFIARLAPNWPGRVALLALLVGIPFWELPYGYYNFRTLCEENGGLKVFERFPAQKSVCAIFPLDTSAGQFFKAGFETVETRDASGKIQRLSVGSAGDGKQTNGGELSSHYCVAQSFVQGLPWRVQRNEHRVIGALDSRPAAQFNDYVWFGMWWQQEANPLLGRGGECRHGDAIRRISQILLSGTQ